MKIRFTFSSGHVLVTTLVTTGLLGYVAASYLTLMRSQHQSTHQSLAWNKAIPVAEAGVEEALTHLNKRGLTNLATDGWVMSSGRYTKSRTLDEVYYLAAITPTHPPVIVCTGYVQVPLGTKYVARAVRVTTTNDALFAKGMVAKGQIDLSGNTITSDSFDSSDPNYSTGGRYDAKKNKDNGDIATNSSLINSLNAGNANIYGRVATGPGGSVALGPNGTVGDKAWVNGGKKGIQPGRSTDDMNVTFPDAQAPFTSGGLTPGSGKVGATNYTYVLNSGDYKLTSLSMTGSQKMCVAGQAVLYVTGNVSLAGNAFIYIQPNASLKLYVGGASASLAGKGVINNNANATNFFYYGLPANTSLSLSGNAAFTGVIYAPSAAFTLGGGGSTTYDFVGASITSTVKMNGNFQFHYDEALGRNGPSRGFIITSWNEI
jgi:hypothetical protein